MIRLRAAPSAGKGRFLIDIPMSATFNRGKAPFEEAPAARLPNPAAPDGGMGRSGKGRIDMFTASSGAPQERLAKRLEEMAQDLFEVITHLCLVAPRSRRRAGDLKEIEYLTLAILQERGTMIVGDIQRLLGVLPAQMSRVIRSLEARQWPLIGCRINSNDKRKIDVGLTEVGRRCRQVGPLQGQIEFQPRFFAEVQGQPDLESAAPSQFALQRHVAAQKLGQLANDG